MRTPIRLLFAALVLALPATAALAQRADNRFYGKAGAFFSNVDSNLRIDSTNGQIGTIIDLESDLGLAQRKALPFGLVGWRFSDNWRAEFEYFKLSREQTRTIDKTLTIGNTVYPVNANLTSGLSTEVFRLGVGYSFARGEDFEVGGILGLHMTNFAVFAEGTGTVGNAGGTQRREARDQLVPLPTLGLYGSYDINDTISIVSRVSYFQLKISDYEGRLLDGSIGLTAYISKNFGVGADFRYVNYRLTADAPDFSGRINYNFYGPFVYVIAGF